MRNQRQKKTSFDLILNILLFFHAIVSLNSLKLMRN